MGFSKLFATTGAPGSGAADGRNPADRDLRLVLMDGGLGTTLEDDFHMPISDTALWSARLIHDDPATLAQAHTAFVDTGCHAIMTATYQCAFETFRREGYDEARAIELMQSAVRIARKAITSDPVQQTSTQAPSATSTDPPPHSPRLILSVGPYGSTLSPAQEFDGFYPPPFGPMGFSKGTTLTNAFSEPSSESEETAKRHLAEFHYHRLRSAYIPVWDQLDAIAFETVPVLREAEAIRAAVARLQSEGLWNDKPWFVCFVFPNGLFPHEQSPGGPRVHVDTIVRAMMKETEGAARPDGIGINCTEPRYLTSLVAEFTQAMADIQDHGTSAEKPWFIVYPNGGEVYDVISRTWGPPPTSGPEIHPAEGWATDLIESLGPILNDERSPSLWGGVLLGGCCKAGPKHISSLRQQLERTRRP